jgi:hypothetical protein
MSSDSYPSYAIAIARIAGHKKDGGPAVFTSAAVCDVCGSWATDVCTSGTIVTAGDDIIDSRISRHVHVIVYACPKHYDNVMDSLVEEFGSACNRYDPDDLAIEVERQSKLRVTGS